jgi:hypothetical protein
MNAESTPSLFRRSSGSTDYRMCWFQNTLKLSEITNVSFYLLLCELPNDMSGIQSKNRHRSFGQPVGTLGKRLYISPV